MSLTLYFKLRIKISKKNISEFKKNTIYQFTRETYMILNDAKMKYKYLNTTDCLPTSIFTLFFRAYTFFPTAYKLWYENKYEQIIFCPFRSFVRAYFVTFSTNFWGANLVSLNSWGSMPMEHSVYG